MTTAYGKGIDLKLVMIVAGIVVAIILALAISSMGQSAELPSSMKVEVPNPIEKIIPSTDPIEERLQEIATEEYPSIEASMIELVSTDKLTVDDFCNEIIIMKEEKDPLIGDAIGLGTTRGYYAGPLLFLDEKGNEVKLISDVAIDSEGGLLIPAKYKDCQIIGLKEVNSRFKEEFIYFYGTKDN